MIDGVSRDLIWLVHSLLTVYIWVVIIGALLTWVRPDPYNPIVQFIHRVTEPAYKLVRKFMPTFFNGIDFAPIIIIILLNIVDILLINIIRTM